MRCFLSNRCGYAPWKIDHGVMQLTVLTLTILGFMMAGVWNGNWSSIGWHEGWEEPYDTSAGSHSWEVLISMQQAVRIGVSGRR